jgi:hypothetical protein
VAGERVQGDLGRGVRGQPLLPLPRGQGGDVDDRSAAGGHQGGQGFADHERGAGDVDAHHLVPHVGVHGVDALVAGHEVGAESGGDVGDAVEPAEVVGGLGDQRDDGVRVPEVELEREEPVGRVPRLLTRTCELGGVGAGRGHLGAFGQQPPHGGRADA